MPFLGISGASILKFLPEILGIGGSVAGGLLGGGGEIPDVLQRRAGMENDALQMFLQGLFPDILNELRTQRGDQQEVLGGILRQGGLNLSGLPGLSGEEAQFLDRFGTGSRKSEAVPKRRNVDRVFGDRPLGPDINFVQQLQQLAPLLLGAAGSGSTQGNLGQLTQNRDFFNARNISQGFGGILDFIREIFADSEQTIDAPPAQDFSNLLIQMLLGGGQ